MIYPSRPKKPWQVYDLSMRQKCICFGMILGCSVVYLFCFSLTVACQLSFLRSRSWLSQHQVFPTLFLSKASSERRAQNWLEQLRNWMTWIQELFQTPSAWHATAQAVDTARLSNSLWLRAKGTKARLWLSPPLFPLLLFSLQLAVFLLFGITRKGAKIGLLRPSCFQS